MFNLEEDVKMYYRCGFCSWRNLGSWI